MKYLILASSLLLFACGGDKAEDDKDDSLTRMVEEPLDKAEAVEDAVLEAKDRVDAALQEAENADP